MDVIELMKQRKSVRCFYPDQPSRNVIAECLEAASWAPNPTCQQPWKFIVLSGEALRKVIAVIEENFSTAQGKRSEESAPYISSNAVRDLEERKTRHFQAMIAYLKERGVDLQSVGHGNFRFHGAPLGIIFATYPCKDLNYIKATVAAMENFLIAAAGKGLGTCWMNAVSICQESIKHALQLPAELILVDGVAVGYPQEASPLNGIPRSRLPINEVTIWL